MKHSAFRIRTFGGSLLALFLWLPANGQPVNASGQASPDVNQIVANLVRNNQDRARLLQHYQGCRHYLLDYRGFPAHERAEMVVGMRYDAPADKQFRILHEGGARLLLNRVLKQLLENEKEAAGEQNQHKTALTPENYDFQLVGSDRLDGRTQYVLEVSPRSSNKFLYRGKIWVDAEDYAVSRIEAEPAKNPSFWISHTDIEHQYTKIGDFWLPARNVSVSKIRFGGTAKLNIEYSDYRVGNGEKALGDDVCGDLTHEARVSKNQ